MISVSSVCETGREAASCKRTCVDRGYFADPFIRHFAKPSSRRTPLINRGYWLRMAIFDRVLRRFIDCCSALGASGQVVNLGCGVDTHYFRLKSHQTPICLSRFFDVDHQQVINSKLTTIASHSELSSILRLPTAVVEYERFAAHTSWLPKPASSSSSNPFVTVPRADIDQCPKLADSVYLPAPDYALIAADLCSSDLSALLKQAEFRDESALPFCGS